MLGVKVVFRVRKCLQKGISKDCFWVLDGPELGTILTLDGTSREDILEWKKDRVGPCLVHFQYPGAFQTLQELLSCSKKALTVYLL